MKKYQKTIEEINHLIENSDRILITSHENPDGDSIGSQLALGEFLKVYRKVFWILNHGELPAKYTFIDPEGFIKTKDTGLEINPDLVIVIECPNLNRIGWVRKHINDNIPIINIDHHENNQRFGDINFVDTSQAAVGEMVYDIVRLNGYCPGKLGANALYLAIYTDTGRFRHDSTTPEALKTCAELIEFGADPKTIADNAYCSYPAPALKLLGEILRKLELVLDDRVCLLTVTAEDMKATGANIADIEGVIDYSLYIDSVLVGLLFKQLDDHEVKVSFRCREDYDILPIAALFGGGGHRHAAGCSVPGSLDNARRLIIDALRNMLDG